MWILEILIFALTFMIAAHVWRKRRDFYLAHKIPNSTFDKSLGAIPKYFKPNTKMFFEEISKAFQVAGLTKTRLAHVLIINITTPEDVKIVLSSKECLDKPYFVKLFGAPKGSLFGEVEPWRTHRKVLSPYFNFHSLRLLMPIINGKVQNLMRILEKKENEEFNVFPHIVALLFDSITSSMELDFDVQNMEETRRNKIVHSLEIFAEIFILRIMQVWLHLRCLYKMSNLSKLHKKSKATFEEFTHEIVRKTSEKIVRENNNEKPATFIRALVDPKHGFSHAEICDEINSLMLAAQDTSGVTISSTLLLLAMHKDVQDKVSAELRQILGAFSENLHLDVEQLSQLVYLEMVINEVMRFMAVVPVILRTNEQEFTSSEGYVIPAKSALFIPIFYIHKNKDFWGEDADKFRPERFEKEEFSKIHPFAYLPFAKGPRMCLGWCYAMLLMKTALANILLKYEIDTSLKLSELEYKLNITLNVCQGYRISMKKRPLK